MKYRANPVIVDAFQITNLEANESMELTLMFEDRINYIPSDEMLSRIAVKIGDYLVIQEDGYEYLNPQSVFERKYTRVTHE